MRKITPYMANAFFGCVWTGEKAYFCANYVSWGYQVYNEKQGYIVSFHENRKVTTDKLMASRNKKQIPASPVAQRKTQKTNKVNLYAEKNNEITVVGIGASAGGLKALQEFFEALPSDTGMAYVVITHLHPEHESHLPELLQRYTHNGFVG